MRRRARALRGAVIEEDARRGRAHVDGRARRRGSAPPKLSIVQAERAFSALHRPLLLCRRQAGRLRQLTRNGSGVNEESRALVAVRDASARR